MSDPARRLLQVLSLLQRRLRWTGPELAEQLGVTVRTVRRDVDRLRSLGYPIDAEPGPDGGYRLGTGGDLPPLLLEDDEATAIAVALGASAASAVRGIEDAALSAFAKVHRLLPPRVRARVEALRVSTDRLVPLGDAVDAEVLVVLALAIDSAERVALAYVDRAGRRTERRVEPYRLVSTHRRWYVLAFDVDRSDWRTFRVDRIESVRATGHRFVPVEVPDAAAIVREAITAAPYRYQVEVLFDTDPATLAARVPPSVASIEARDGGAVLRTGGDHLAAIAGHLVALDLPFRVLDPPELREHLRRVGAALRAV